MASYQPTILPASDPTGFMPGLGQGLNSYAQAAIDRQKRKKQEEELNKYAQAAELDVDSVTIDENGELKRTYKKRKTEDDTFMKDPVKAIKQAMAGLRSPEEFGSLVGIENQTPAMSLPTGQQGDIYGSPVVDKSEAIKAALMQKFAPGKTQEQVMLDTMGLPQNPIPEAMKDTSGSDLPLNIDSVTERVLGNIQSPEDFDELISNEEAYKKEGVNVEAIKRYIQNNPFPQPKVGLLEKISGFFGGK